MAAFYWIAVLIPTLLGLSFALVEIVAPRQFLAWRAGVVAKRRPWSQRLASGVDETLGLRREAPWNDDASVKRIRTFGFVLLAVMAIEAVVFLWWLPSTSGGI